MSPPRDRDRPGRRLARPSTAPDAIAVTVAWATPDAQDVVALRLPAGATVGDAVARSALAGPWGFEPGACSFAIAGRRVRARPPRCATATASTCCGRSRSTRRKPAAGAPPPGARGPRGRRRRRRRRMSDNAGHARPAPDRPVVRPTGSAVGARRSVADRRRSPSQPRRRDRVAPGWPRSRWRPGIAVGSTGVRAQEAPAAPAADGGVTARARAAAHSALEGAQGLANHALSLLGVKYKFGGNPPGDGTRLQRSRPVRLPAGHRRHAAPHGEGDEPAGRQGRAGRTRSGRPRLLQHAPVRVLARGDLSRRQPLHPRAAPRPRGRDRRDRPPLLAKALRRRAPAGRQRARTRCRR